MAKTRNSSFDNKNGHNSNNINYDIYSIKHKESKFIKI